MATEAPLPRRVCEVRRLGSIDYSDGLSLQARAVERLRSGEGPEQLLLLEHPHVFTLGRGADRANILADHERLRSLSIEVHETGRGGDVTYHGPGQMVGYPIVNLKPDRCDVHRYVRDIEEVLIRAIGDFGIRGERIAGLTGVWVGNEKVAAIGVRIARWITSHGFALNVNTDLDYFRLIVPCGITDKGVTSLSRLLGGKIDMGEVASRVSRRFGEVFERDTPATEVGWPGGSSCV
ncbi:MAG TPA: lipoyl(octanoyl) transferase LipB [Blastocatellia bacterium]|jgi:lipoyl(octanoyl) transferase|nr:lipoyl(octanoyl) transferase LipB [Blastocatellia bacterium]